MFLESQKKECIKMINKWKDLVAVIELTDENIISILKCLDFGSMYDKAQDLKILKGYLFNEDYKNVFLDTTSKALLSGPVIEGERMQLRELLSNSPEDFLEMLLIPVRAKIAGKNEIFTEKHEECFYKIMTTVAQYNVEAIEKFLITKRAVV